MRAAPRSRRDARPRDASDEPLESPRETTSNGASGPDARGEVGETRSFAEKRRRLSVRAASRTCCLFGSGTFAIGRPQASTCTSRETAASRA